LPGEDKYHLPEGVGLSRFDWIDTKPGLGLLRKEMLVFSC
jgi:hypothetical protein